MAKHLLPILLAFCLLFSACASPAASDVQDDDRLHIVTSAYPAYDFARTIAGDHASVTMLVKPGVDPHEYEPTPQNMIDLETCDVFIYNGGHSDAWVERLLSGIENQDLQIVRMMDCVETLEEEVLEGMTTEHHEHEAEHDHDEDHVHSTDYDEHIWMSPRNVMVIADAIAETLAAMDSAHAADYQTNLSAYQSELTALDAEFTSIVDAAPTKTLVFADRFPARYFTEAYGLSYYAAFPGCSSQTEPDAATVAFLIETIREEQIPAVFRVPFSGSTLPETIQEETGAEILLFHSFHNVTSEEFGMLTYLDVMKQNAEALKLALNVK